MRELLSPVEAIWFESNTKVGELGREDVLAVWRAVHPTLDDLFGGGLAHRNVFGAHFVQDSKLGEKLQNASVGGTIVAHSLMMEHIFGLEASHGSELVVPFERRKSLLDALLTRQFANFALPIVDRKR